jgi:hypothetical protein
VKADELGNILALGELLMTPRLKGHTAVAAAAVLGLVTLVVLLNATSAIPGYAQTGFPPPEPSSDVTGPTPDRSTQIDQLRRASVRLPIAAGLAVILALRPRRKGTPHRRAAVIQTQVILAIVGAVVMLVVGASLARAFGIVGAAGLVRYRAKIDDPKDAGVMLSTLAVGLAAGVGLWMLAVFATFFVMLVLGVIESFEPKTTRQFTLEIKAQDPAAFKPKLEEILRRTRWEHELRAEGKEELSYDVQVPLDKKTDRLSEQILKADPDKVTEVEWKEKKDKK